MTTTKTSESAAKKDVAKLQRAIVDGLEDVKAQDIQVFDTEHLSPLFERVIVASGTSNRQTKALAASVRDKVKEAGFPKPRTEGEDNGEWIIVDCGAAVAHIMQPTIRQYYRLEELWGELPLRLKLGAAKPVAREAKVPLKTAARRAAKAAEAEGALPAKKAPARKGAALASTSRAPARKAVKPAVKSAQRPATKPAAKPAAQPAPKTPTKTASKTTAKSPGAKTTGVKTLIVKPRSTPVPAKKAAPAKRGASVGAKASPVKRGPAKSAPAKVPAAKALAGKTPGRKS